jgi:hypothetical protein
MPTVPLTELQQSRIAFHLDVWEAKSLLSIDREIKFVTLSDTDRLALVGPETIEAPLEAYLFQGQELCSTTSILGRLERAFDNIDPSVISDSLLVKSAGKVSLRSDELKAREKLYRSLLKSLAKIMGYRDPGNTRVGF